jgi:hypothetical protein
MKRFTTSVAQAALAATYDPVTVAGHESFPEGDPPAWTVTRIVG